MSDLHDTVQALLDAKLTVMAKHLKKWCADPKNLQRSHVACVHALIRAHAQQCQSQRTNQFLVQAGFAPNVALTNVWTGDPRGLTATTLANLALCTWVDAGRSLLITGEHGSGKTFLAAALAREAALTRRAIRYQVLSPWLSACESEPADAPRLLRPLKNATLLVLDHVAEDVISENMGTRLRDLIDERVRRERATIFISSRALNEWLTAFENPETAQAIVHRVSQNTTTITLRKQPATPARMARKRAGQTRVGKKAAA